MPTNNSVCISDNRLSLLESDVKVIKTQHLGLEKGLAELTDAMKQLINEMAKSRDNDHKLALENVLQLSKLEELERKVTSLHARLDRSSDRLEVLEKKSVTSDNTNRWVDRAVVGGLAAVAGYILKSVGLI